MRKYTEKQVVMISEVQKETLKRLKDVYNINPSYFIRQAISEKLQRNKLEIKESIKEKLPF